MMKEHFQHFTFNTGHNLCQTHFQLDAAEKSSLCKLAQDSLRPEGTAIIGNITFEAVKEKDMYIGTLFSNIDSKKIPLLTTLGARTEESGQRLWEMTQEVFIANRNVTRMKRCRPQAPFVADLLYHCCMPDEQAAHFFFSGLSGSFCKYIGWAFLFSELFEGCHGRAAEEGRDGSAKGEAPA